MKITIEIIHQNKRQRPIRSAKTIQTCDENYMMHDRHDLSHTTCSHPNAYSRYESLELVRILRETESQLSQQSSCKQMRRGTSKCHSSMWSEELPSLSSWTLIWLTLAFTHRQSGDQVGCAHRVTFKKLRQTSSRTVVRTHLNNKMNMHAHNWKRKLFLSASASWKSVSVLWALCRAGENNTYC